LRTKQEDEQLENGEHGGGKKRKKNPFSAIGGRPYGTQKEERIQNFKKNHLPASIGKGGQWRKGRGQPANKGEKPTESGKKVVTSVPNNVRTDVCKNWGRKGERKTLVHVVKRPPFHERKGLTRSWKWGAKSEGLREGKANTLVLTPKETWPEEKRKKGRGRRVFSEKVRVSKKRGPSPKRGTLVGRGKNLRRSSPIEGRGSLTPTQPPELGRGGKSEVYSNRGE